MTEPRTRTTIRVQHVRRVAVKSRMLQKGRDQDTAMPMAAHDYPC